MPGNLGKKEKFEGSQEVGGKGLIMHVKRVREEKEKREGAEPCLLGEVMHSEGGERDHAEALLPWVMRSFKAPGGEKHRRMVKC